MSAAPFVRRHIGPSREDIEKMARIVGAESLAGLIDQTVPESIRLRAPLNLPAARSEETALRDLRAMIERNELRQSLIGMGYANCHTPAVIRRNILENPGWYTAYTPYQAEIAQGRMEALLNFQTMVCDLTGMEISNASLLDESTAAAEAMTMAHAIKSGGVFFVADDCHPQTIALLRTRAEPLGIRLIIGPVWDFTSEPVFGALIQYPATDGVIHDLGPIIKRVHAGGALFIAAVDLLAMTLIKPPGEYGSDIVVGSTQRFGVSLGYGGPHAAFLATRDEHKRRMPGRLGRRFARRGGASRLAPHLANARAAYPPGKGDEQYLHSSGAPRRDGFDVRRLSRPSRVEVHRGGNPSDDLPACRRAQGTRLGGASRTIFRHHPCVARGRSC